MKLLVLCLCFFLASCQVASPAIPATESGLLILAPVPKASKEESASSLQATRKYFAKFSTNGALNSHRNFVSDYIGEIRITVYPNSKIECTWWAEGNVTDITLFDGTHSVVEAFSSVCIGRLLNNETFEFQGSYVRSGPEPGIQSGELAFRSDETFTLTGKIKHGSILGDLIMGDVFGNYLTLHQPETMHDSTEGIRFSASALSAEQ